MKKMGHKIHFETLGYAWARLRSVSIVWLHGADRNYFTFTFTSCNDGVIRSGPIASLLCAVRGAPRTAHKPIRTG